MPLAKILQRVNKNRRTLNRSCQYAAFLQSILTGPDARWLLASILFPAIRPSPQPHLFVEQSQCPQLIDVTAYVLYIDASVRHEMAFKLLPCTQAKLVRLHRDICLAYNESPSSNEVNEVNEVKKGTVFHELNKNFAHAIDRAIFQSSVSELENLEDDGSGELLGHRPEIVRRAKSRLRICSQCRSGLCTLASSVQTWPFKPK